MIILAFTTPGPSEWMFILIIVLVLFGAKKLPDLAKSIGQSMNEFRRAREDFDRELQAAGKDVNAKPPNTQPYQAPAPQPPIAAAPAPNAAAPAPNAASPAPAPPAEQPSEQPTGGKQA
jgi:sec-independent protein translocase protein TatA